MSCYSLDLRKSVVSFLKEGNSIRKTAIIFNISYITVFNWKKRDSINKLSPCNNLIRSPQKLNPNILETYIEKHPEQTLEQIAKHFNVSIPAIFYRIKKLNFTYKKKNFSTKKETGKEEKNTSKKS